MILPRLDEVSLPGDSLVEKLVSAGIRRPLRRIGLRRRLQRGARKPGLTVLVGVRNRSGHRLRNLLASLSGQSAREASRVLLVDHGSDPGPACEIAALAREFGAEVVRLEATGPWSRAAALNAGLRRVLTTHVLCADADLVFERTYVETALAKLTEDPRRVVVSTMLDLPEGHAREILPERFAALRASASVRAGSPFHPSILAVATAALVAVGGYDERYRLWGMEDVDLFARLRAFGLETCNVAAETAYLHQWHPKFDGVAGGDLDRQIRANERLFRRKRSREASPRRALVTAAGPRMWPLLERYSLPTFRRFAEIHGYDVVPIRLDRDDADAHGAEARAARWAKIPLLRDALAVYDLVAWLDADVMVCRFDDDLARHLAPDKFQAFVLEQVPQDRRVNPNSGVWVLRRSRRAMRFLRAVERAGQQPGPWADQAAIMKVLGWDAGGAWYHDAGPGRGSSFLRRTGWLPPSWNQLHAARGERPGHVHAVPRVERPHAVHFAGLDDDARERLMRDMLARIE